MKQAPHRELKIGIEIMVLVAILAVGGCLRFTYLLEIRDDPGLVFPPVDAGFNLYWARGLATGDWTLPPDANGRDPLIRETAFQRSPGYPYVLAALYRLTGGQHLALRAMQMLGGLAAVVLAWWVGRRLFSPGVGLTWAAAFAIHWGFIYFEAGLDGIWLVHLLFLVLLLVMRDVVVSARWFDGAQVGALVGISALVRSNALLLGPVLGVWIVVVVKRRYGMKSALTSLAAATLAGALVLAPTTVRNFRVSGYFVPVSANGGLTLYHGNNPSATGYSTAAVGELGFFASPWHSSDVVARASRRAGREMNYVEASRQAGRQAREWMKENPADALRLVATRALLFWGPHEMAHSTAVAADRQASPLLRRLPFSFSWIVAGGLWGVGIWVLARRRAAVRPLPEGTAEVAVGVGLVVAAWFVSFQPFFVTSLYRMSVVPAFLFAASVGVVATVGLVRSGQSRAALAGVGVLALCWSVARVPIVTVDVGVTERLVLRGSQWRARGDLKAAEQEFREALRLKPDSQAAENGLAAVLMDLGQFAEAVPLLDSAVWSSPSDPLLHFNLGLARLRSDDVAGAVASLCAATELAPNLLEAHVLLGSSYEKIGDLRSAIETYDRALVLDPDDVEANNNLAWLLATAGHADLRDGERAVELARRSVARLRVPATLDTLAAALAEAGRFDEAVATLDEAIRTNQEQSGVSMEEFKARRRVYQSGRPYRL